MTLGANTLIGAGSASEPDPAQHGKDTAVKPLTEISPEGDKRTAKFATGGERPPLRWDGMLVYTLALAGLMAALGAVSGLLALGVGIVVQNTTTLGTLISNQDARTQASSLLAALIVGLPVWRFSWHLAQRRVEHSPEERNALERRLFFAAVFAVTSILSLIALQGLLRNLLQLPPAIDQLTLAKGAVMFAAQLLTYGLAWLYYARMGWRERSPRASDVPHDLAVYVLTACALVMLVVGSFDALRHIIMALQGTTDVRFDTTNVTWTVWAGIASFLLAGGAVWSAIWRYDLARGGRHFVRVIYLYLVLWVAVPMTAIGAGVLLTESLRRIFGYHVPFGNDWAFLVDAVPPLVVGGALWIYHWMILRRQAAIFDRPAPITGGILWPQRLYFAGLSLTGLATAAVAFVSLLWLGIDQLLGSHEAAYLGGGWWIDRLSWSLAGLLGGSALWLPAWARLQQAASADPQRERPAWERRWLLGVIVIAAALAGLGFAIGAFYQVFRGLLQTTDANTLSDGLRYGSATVVAAAIAIYHGLIYQRDRSAVVPAPVRVRVSALITAGTEETLKELKQRSGQRIERIGYLTQDDLGQLTDLATLQDQLATLATRDHIDRALLVLRADGGLLYPYTSSPQLAGMGPQGSAIPEITGSMTCRTPDGITRPQTVSGTERIPRGD